MAAVFAQSADAAEVASIQRALTERGFDASPVDGLPGRRTTQALRDFQKANGIPETGETDADTLVLLGLIEPSETPENSANAEETAAATEASLPEPAPIAGDLDTAMALFGHTYLHHRQRAGVRP